MVQVGARWWRAAACIGVSGWSLVASCSSGSDGEQAANPLVEAGSDEEEEAGASDPTTGPQCPEPSNHRLLACTNLAPEANEDRAHIEGTVSSVTPGWSCQVSFGSPYTGTEDRAWSFTVTEGARTALVSVLLPWSIPLVAVGDALSVDYARSSSLYNHDHGSSDLLVRTQAGELVLWVAHDFTPANLTPPEELQVEDGRATCSDDGRCGAWEQRTLRVTVSGVQQEVIPGTHAQVADLTIVNHTNNQDLDGNTSDCVFEGANLVTMAAVGEDMPVLDALERGSCGAGACSDSDYCAIPAAAQCARDAPDAACEPRPASCPVECNGVCGCDGKFYCSECEARRLGMDVAAGVSTCSASGCESAVGAEGPTRCSFYWSCFERAYELHCELAGDTASCECVLDGSITGSFDTQGPPQCGAAENAGRCGFPSW